MWSRRLGLVSLALVVGCGIADRAHAQAWDNYFNQTPSRVFAQNCNNCHASPRGLVKRVSPGYLPQFLRQHFTAWETADRMAAWLLANNAPKSRKPRAATKPPAAGGDGNTGKPEPAPGKRRPSAPAPAKTGAPTEKPAAAEKTDDTTLTPETRRAKQEYERGKGDTVTRSSGASTPESEAPAAASESAPKAETPATETPAAETPAAETPAAESPASEKPASESSANDGKGTPAEPAEEAR